MCLVASWEKAVKRKLGRKQEVQDRWRESVGQEALSKHWIQKSPSEVIALEPRRKKKKT